jgi:citronellol/citronellal dehydrogenase
MPEMGFDFRNKHVLVTGASEGIGEKFAAGIYNSEQISARFPLRRPGTCEEVAYAVLFFASDFASYITGQTLAVDGGPPISGFTD